MYLTLIRDLITPNLLMDVTHKDSLMTGHFENRLSVKKKKEYIVDTL